MFTRKATSYERGKFLNAKQAIVGTTFPRNHLKPLRLDSVAFRFVSIQFQRQHAARHIFHKLRSKFVISNNKKSSPDFASVFHVA